MAAGLVHLGPSSLGRADGGGGGGAAGVGELAGMAAAPRGRVPVRVSGHATAANLSERGEGGWGWRLKVGKGRKIFVF